MLFATGRTNAQKRSATAGTQSVPSPQSVLGFAPGSDRTIADWKQISDYFARLDQASDRVHVQTIGATTLNRPMIAVFVSASENIRNLNKIKEIQRRLSDPRTITNDRERDSLLRNGKTVVAITCSIHSTEIVASQMSMQLAYDLATANDSATREILQNTILILIPSVNPDGVDIVADWYRKTLRTAYEGTSPPELYHHYAGHDNNRDWFMLNLRETQHLTRLFWKEWFPQIVYDIHQQGQEGPRFFVPPFYDPSNPNIHPLIIREIAALGSKIATDLQAANFRGVITNAQYDTWWHGGLRTSPYYHNSIGILSEAASAKLMTPVQVTEEQLAKSKSRGMASALEPTTNQPDPWRGGLWRPADIMAMEMSAARTILTMAGKYRSGYLRNFYELSRSAVSDSPPPNHPLAYLIQAGQGNDEAVARLIEILIEQGVVVHRMTHELHMTTKDYAGDENAEIPLGSYLIFMAQPARRNVQALFEHQVYPDRRAANGEAEPPYDVAGWTLPMQMGIETSAVATIRESPHHFGQLKLVRDPSEVRTHLGLDLKRNGVSPIPNPITKAVRTAVYKAWTAVIDEGWTRQVFDTFNVPYTTLRDNDVRAGNLRQRFDVIILPSQRADDIVGGNKVGTYPAEFTGGITLKGVENLRLFVEQGGTLICLDAAAELAIKNFNLPVRNVLEGIKRNEFYCPGSILRLDVNIKDPVALGARVETDAYFINGSAFETTQDTGRVRVIARYTKTNLLRSGWLVGKDLIAGRIAIASVTLGEGHVIIFGIRPQHRGQTWGTFSFLFNAILSGTPAKV
jgi:hypothetical protein